MLEIVRLYSVQAIWKIVGPTYTELCVEAQAPTAGTSQVARRVRKTRVAVRVRNGNADLDLPTTPLL